MAGFQYSQLQLSISGQKFEKRVIPKPGERVSVNNEGVQACGTNKSRKNSFFALGEQYVTSWSL